jgi:Carboxypeptidase regulatory-like domain
MRRNVVTAAVLLCLVISFNTWSQSTNATVGGTVQDATGAFIPGVTVTATNVATGIVTTVISNEAGVYQFASLQPGTYEIKSELPGFQTAVVKDFQLGGAQQARLNFTLQVGAAAGTTIDVAVAADTLLATSSNSVGTILQEYKIRDLPLSSRDVIALVGGTAGVQRTNDANNLVANFAGGRISQVNTTRDGMNVSAGRFEDGAWSLTYTSPDLVEEVKVVIAPVDAQTSRGSAQVSMVTRSGTNQFHGSVFWANHNSALDASSWFNNLNNVAKNYDNRNQFGGRLGGPIFKNKTFFFVLFEGQRDLKRENVIGTTLTDMARQGIFRYFPGVDNGNINSTNPTVDRNGNPLVPRGATGPLSAIDLFGNCTFNGAPVQNCQQFRDPLRSAISTSPYMQETLRRMPRPNEFTTNATGEPVTDGLNTANIRFIRRVEGLDLTLGNGPDVDRDQYNARIDHVINSKHKLSFIGTKEKTWGNASQAIQRSWPDGFDGLAVKRPDVYIMSFTSTLSSTLLNEVRAGRRRSIDLQYPPANRPDAAGQEALKFVPFANGVPFHPLPMSWTGFITYGRFGRWRGHVSPMYSIGDDLSWTHGKHAFKGGFEFRNTLSSGFGDPGFTPYATFGAGNQTIGGLDSNGFPGLSANAGTAARNLLTDLTASVGIINQSFGIKSAKDTTLKGSPEIPAKYFRQVQREMSAYFKDEWKFRPDLTLNLGVHWEYYGQPFEKTGLDARVVGDDQSAFTKINCPASPGTAGFDTTCTNLAQVQFVGKNSTHPDVLPNFKGNDLNNWAPSVGLSWNLPWFGKDKTVLRSGYGINYIGALRNFITVDNTLGTVPGINIVGSGGTGITYNPTSYTNISTVSLPVPFPAGTPNTSPFIVPTTDRTQTISTYNRVAAYTQNWNLELQRQLAENTTFEIRYIGTKGTKLWGTVNLNQIDALHRNKDLFDAFNTVRAGGESPLLTQILMGTNLGGTGAQAVNGSTWTGAMAVRTNTTTRAYLANGSVGAFLDYLNTNTTGTGSSNRGALLRRNGFPENYVVVNPQFATVSILNNLGNSTYHSMQMQFTRRLTKGFTNTTTWTWSRSIGDSDDDGGANYRDPTRRSIEKKLLGFDRAHQFTSHGTYELPFGTGHFLLGNAPGWMQQIVNKWQLGGVMNFNTGAPLSLTTCTLLAGNCPAGTGVYPISFGGQSAAGTPNVVGAVPKDMGKITKAANGVQYFDGFRQVDDPGFANVSPACAASTAACNSLFSGYNNKAIQGPDGQIILVNPQPGEIGTLGYATVRGPRLLNFDMNLIKRFQIHESKNFEFRLDVINILNHPNFGNPIVNVNAANNTFGRISSATGSRSFIVNTRINF